MGWKIHVLDWTRNPLPITRSKLSHEIAKKVERYLNYITVGLCFDGINIVAAHIWIVELCFGRIC